MDPNCVDSRFTARRRPETPNSRTHIYLACQLYEFVLELRCAARREAHQKKKKWQSTRPESLLGATPGSLVGGASNPSLAAACFQPHTHIHTYRQADRQLDTDKQTRHVERGIEHTLNVSNVAMCCLSLSLANASISCKGRLDVLCMQRHTHVSRHLPKTTARTTSRHNKQAAFTTVCAYTRAHTQRNTDRLRRRSAGSVRENKHWLVSSCHFLESISTRAQKNHSTHVCTHTSKIDTHMHTHKPHGHPRAHTPATI